VDAQRENITVSLFDGRLVTLGGDRPAGIVSFEETQIDLDTSSKDKRARVKLSEMSWLSLKGELARVERELTAASPTAKPGGQGESARREFRRLKEELESRIRFQMHRQVAFAFASFGLTLVGIPLGIRVHRRETNVGIAIALVLVAVYYGLVLVASGLDDKPHWAPHLLVWVPNLLFQIGGVIMLLRANKGA
jgi:lipopolysaccharide export LptBFGC system permease protein LptF